MSGQVLISLRVVFLSLIGSEREYNECVRKIQLTIEEHLETDKV